MNPQVRVQALFENGGFGISQQDSGRLEWQA
jgi:hypothetical protein